MIRANRNGNGFTIIEFSLVLVALGILAVVLVPMTQAVHEDAMREQDKNTLETARDALMGYIRINQAIPCIADLGAGPVQITPFGPLNPATGCDPTLTLDLLGMRTTDTRGRTFAFDANEWLTVDHITNTGPDICQALEDIIEEADPTTPPPGVTPPLDPQVCESTNGNTGSTACTPARPYPKAFVLAGRGSDRCFNLENTNDSATNDPVCPTAVVNNRIFENPARLHSKTLDDGYYDDLMLSVTPTELAEALGCTGGGGGICDSGEKYVQVTNNSTGNDGVFLDGACYQALSFTTRILGCKDGSLNLQVWTNQNCVGSMYYEDSVNNIDVNGDDHADLFCTEPNCIPE